MTFKEYSDLAAVTRPKNHDKDREFDHAVLGLASEAGELASARKKVVAYDKPLDVQHCIEEMGDLLWFLALAADALGTSLDAVARGNIAKLKARYPDGRFNVVHATERNTANEMSAIGKAIE